MERGKRNEDRPRPLTAAFVRTIREQGRYSDGPGGHGLSLLVKTGWGGRPGKSWSQRLRIGGKSHDIGLGGYPLVTLAEARKTALENRRAVAEGTDPRKPAKPIPTFASAVERVIEVHAEGWKNPRIAKQWRSSLNIYAIPVLGAKLVSEVTTADVLEVMTPIWSTKRETATKVRERISAILRWSIAEGHRQDDPARDVIAALPKTTQRVQHQKALRFAEVGGAVQQIRQTSAWPATKLAFEFLTLTACRVGEVRQARWTEIHEDSATWVVPASRMKNGLEHRVPLSDQAMDVLRLAEELVSDSGLVFPSVTGRPLSDATVSKLLRENSVAAVPHGMRSSFRDWAAECSDAPREIAEHCLAHVEGSASELAYRRTDYFDRRRGLMQDWADFVLS